MHLLPFTFINYLNNRLCKSLWGHIVSMSVLNIGKTPSRRRCNLYPVLFICLLQQFQHHFNLTVAYPYQGIQNLPVWYVCFQSIDQPMPFLQEQADNTDCTSPVLTYYWGCMVIRAPLWRGMSCSSLVAICTWCVHAVERINRVIDCHCFSSGHRCKNVFYGFYSGHFFTFFNVFFLFCQSFFLNVHWKYHLKSLSKQRKQIITASFPPTYTSRHAWESSSPSKNWFRWHNVNH